MYSRGAVVASRQTSAALVISDRTAIAAGVGIPLIYLES
jgi:hypothetical protein